MTTKVCTISKGSIKRYSGSGYTLKDESKSNFMFRYSRKPNKGTFYLRHWNKKDCWVPLGKWPDISVPTAKAALLVELNKFSLGVQDNDHVADVKLKTVADLMLWHVRRLEDDKKSKNIVSIKSLVKLHIIARMGTVRLSQLSLSKVDGLIYKAMVAEGYTLGTIEQVYIRFKSAFAAAMKLHILSKNPIDDLSLSSSTTAKPSLKVGGILLHDLPKVLAVINSKPAELRMMVNLMLCFAVRVGEAAGAAWSEFDLDNAIWRIPASRVKNKEEHVLYLPGAFISVLKKYKREQMKAGRNSMYLFPQKRNKRKPTTANYASRKVSLAFKGRYVSHDFRKLARNWWVESGVDFYVGELILNHKVQGVSRHYIFTTAKAKMIDALTAWYECCYVAGFYHEYEKMPRLRAA